MDQVRTHCGSLAHESSSNISRLMKTVRRSLKFKPSVEGNIRGMARQYIEECLRGGDQSNASMSPVNISEWARQVAQTHQISSAKAYRIALLEWLKVCRQRVDPQMRGQIRQYLTFQTPLNPTRISKYCDDLDHLFSHLPRHILHHVIQLEMASLQRRTLTKAQRLLAKQTVQRSTTSNMDISALIEKLSQQLNVTKSIIVDMIRNETMRRERRSISQTTKLLIREHLQNLGSTQYDIGTVCDALQSQIPVSRRTLHMLVRNEREKMRNFSVLDAHIDLVREHIQKFSSETNIPKLCDELQGAVPLPRKILSRLIRGEIGKRARTNLQDETINTVKKYLEQPSHAEQPIVKICDNIQQETTTPIPRGVLYETVTRMIVLKRQKQVNPEQKNTVRQFLLEHSKLLGDHPQLCNLLERKLSIPRPVLYRLVKGEEIKIVRQMVSKEKQQSLRNLLRNNPSNNEAIDEWIEDCVAQSDLPQRAWQCFVLAEKIYIKSRMQRKTAKKEQDV